MSLSTLSGHKSRYQIVISNLSVEKYTLSTVTGFEPESFDCITRGLPLWKGMPDACVAQFFRAVDRQSKDQGSNPGKVESVSFSTERF